MKLTVLKVYAFAALVVLVGSAGLYMVNGEVQVESFIYKSLSILLPLALFVGGMHLILAFNKQKYIPEFIGLQLVGHLGIMFVALLARGQDISLDLAHLIVSGYFAGSFLFLTGSMLGMLLSMLFYVYMLRVCMYLQYKHAFSMALFALLYYVIFAGIAASGLFVAVLAFLA
ncbi:hypothetical protein EBR77_00135 [bacterium]|jgi:hypothetical protein|nr:hypothetical protein [bacterium]